MTTAIEAYRQAAGAYVRALNGQGSEGRTATGADDTASTGASFADMVRSSLHETIEHQRAAERQASEAVSGRGDLNAVVTSVAEAEVALQAVVAIRDRVVEAYKDVLRMPV